MKRGGDTTRQQGATLDQRMAPCVSGYGLCRHGCELDGHVETWLGDVTGCHWAVFNLAVVLPSLSLLLLCSIALPDAGELVSDPFQGYSFPGNNYHRRL